MGSCPISTMPCTGHRTLVQRSPRSHSPKPHFTDGGTEAPCRKCPAYDPACQGRAEREQRAFPSAGFLLPVAVSCRRELGGPSAVSLVGKFAASFLPSLSFLHPHLTLLTHISSLLHYFYFPVFQKQGLRLSARVSRSEWNSLRWSPQAPTG